MRFTPSTCCRVLMLAAVCCLFLAPITVRAEEPLRWKFEVGETLDYEMKQDMNMNMNAGPAGKLTTTANQLMDMTWSVKSVTDSGDAVIEQKMDRIRVKMAAPGGQGFDYDSDAEGPAVGVAAMVAPMFEAMTSGKFEFTMTPRGEVSNVKLSPELIDAIKKAPGGEAGDDEKAEEKAVEQFKSMISQMAFVLPEKAPQKGETWQTEVTVANPAAGNQSVQTTYTYDGTREIDGTTFAVIKPSMKMELAGNPMMKMEMKEQKTDGEVLFNIGAGRLHSISINQNIALEIAAAGQAMPGTIDQKIELKVTPAEATPATPKPSSEAKSAAPAN